MMQVRRFTLMHNNSIRKKVGFARIVILDDERELKETQWLDFPE